MEQNYRSLFFQYENAENRIEFFTASEEHIPQEILTGLKQGALTCKPRFLIYLVRNLLNNNLFRKVKRKRKSTVQISRR